MRAHASSRFVALLAGPALAAAASLAEWYVDVNAPNCAAGTGSASAPFCNIMDAVNAASGGDTIHIAPGTYVENLVLDKDLTLIGTGGELVTIVDGAHGGSVITVDGAATTHLMGLTLTNGRAIRGGGVFVESSPTSPAVVLTDSTVADNTAQGEGACGGGIYGSNAVLSLVGSTVSGNVALDLSGSGGGGGVHSRYGAVGLVGSAVSGNTASGYRGGVGGGIWTYGGSLTLTNSTVSGNTAPGGYYSAGGGIYCGYGTTATLTDSLVDGNDAGITGGGIFVYGSGMTLTNTTVNGNTALASRVLNGGGGIANFFGGVTLVDSNVTGNGAETGGGGIYTFAGVLDVTSSEVSSNFATWGGGVYGVSHITTLKSSTLTMNSAGFGGAVSSYIGTLTISSSTLSGNTASGAGGGVSNGNGRLVLTNSTVTGNAAYGGGGPGASGGGGIFSFTYYGGSFSPSSLALTNTTVAMNRAADPAAAGGIELDATTAQQTNCMNCILWGNDNEQISAGPTVTRSIVHGGWTGAGANNLDADPLFVDPASGLFQLSAGSPAIDAGRNRALSGIETDLDGNPRFVDDPATPDTGVSWRVAHVPSGRRGFGPIIDLGAYVIRCRTPWAVSAAKSAR